MNLQNKQKFDHYVGLPLLRIISITARVLGFLLRRSHAPDPVRSILILKFQGMGSLALAKPALQVLRNEYPNAKIIFWGTPGTTCLADLMPEFDSVLTLNDRNIFRAVFSLTRNLIWLWSQKIDWAFDLEVYSKLSSILVTFSLARNRAGFAVEPARARRNVHTHLMMFNRYWYLGDAYSRLVGMLAKPAVPSTPVRKERKWDPKSYGEWKFPLDTVDKIKNPAIQNANLASKNYIVLNIHSGPLALERRWPIQQFFSFVQWHLQKYPEQRIVLIGHGPAEEKRCRDLSSSDQVITLANQISLEETLLLLNDAALVVSNDTAALHLALSTAAPVIGLFDPTRAKSYFPTWRPNGIAISRDFYCSPCVHHWSPPPCGGVNYCMYAIPVDQVQRAAEVLKSSDQDLPDKGKVLTADGSKAFENAIFLQYEQGLVNHPELPEPN